MEAAAAATAGQAKRSKRVTLANGPVIASIVGAIVGIVVRNLPEGVHPAGRVGRGWMARKHHLPPDGRRREGRARIAGGLGWSSC